MEAGDVPLYSLRVIIGRFGTNAFLKALRRVFHGGRRERKGKRCQYAIHNYGEELREKQI
jgi:hypothetical protein